MTAKDNKPAAAAETTVTSNALAARELEWAVNPPSLLEEHRKANGSIIRTPFPPEPNGYLHIGHAKSMNFNFSLAFEKLGVAPENRRTIFRYDDTNPEAESTSIPSGSDGLRSALPTHPTTSRHCTTWQSSSSRKVWPTCVI
mmetsp:Transcript_26491/g.39366  ORF Transcript_26491/g.39366 Transcript_26491/m.39366 type:complete len:142 (+) Transcript_26491:141-566(+)